LEGVATRLRRRLRRVTRRGRFRPLAGIDWDAMKTAGAIFVGAAGVLAAGVALVEFHRGHVLEVFGWLLVVGGIAVMLAVAIWAPLRLALPRLARLLGGEIAERLDLSIDVNDLAARIASGVEVPVPESPSQLFPEQVATTVVRDLQDANLVKTPELTEAQQQRRLVAHSALTTIRNHLINLKNHDSKLQPHMRGDWESKRGLLQCSPIYNRAVEETELAFQLISRLEPQYHPIREDAWAEATEHAERALDALRTAMKEDT
jgi:hypothetical protein